MPQDQLDLILLTSDLFFASKIQGTARLCGYDLTIVQQLSKAEEFPPDTCLIIDLESPRLQFERLKHFLESTSPKVIGYAPHVKTELIESGADAGIEHIYSRGEISHNLVKILNELAKADL